jgi:CheY-like chemotaxis protein
MKYSVVIADDFDRHADVIYASLKVTGQFRIILKAFDGKEVLEYLSGKPPFDDRRIFPIPNLVFLDLERLQADDYQVLRWIREKNAAVLPIAVTSSARPELEAAATALGAAGVFSKPLSADDANRILQLAESRFSNPEAGPPGPAPFLPPASGESSANQGRQDTP